MTYQIPDIVPTVQAVVRAKISLGETFSAYDVTRHMRVAFPGERIHHDDIRAIVHTEMTYHEDEYTSELVQKNGAQSPYWEYQPTKSSKIPMISVNSSWIDAIGYDYGSATLVILRNDGEELRYLDVPAHLAWQMLEADSKGKFYNENIRGEYELDD